MASKGLTIPYCDHEMKRKRTTLTLEQKLEILNRADAGEGSASIGRTYNLGESTIRSIKKNAEKIRRSVLHSTPLSAKNTTRVRSPAMEKMESMLGIWVEEQNQKGVNLSSAVIRAKAVQLYKHLQQEMGVAEESFMASKGWFDKFIHRQNLHSIKVSGEVASADHATAAATFPKTLQDIVATEGYSPKQVFNADETELFWKMMPSRTFISRDENLEPGYKSAQDRLKLFLCGNAAGNFKCKPFLVYHSQNSCDLKGNSRHTLPVHWAASKKAWMTGQIMEDWFKYHFIVEAEKYCEKENLPFKILLILDSASGHPKNLASINRNVSVMFLPPNTTFLFQPLDQGVISAFKAHYLRRVISQLLEATNSDSKTSIKQWWKNYNIKDAIKNIRYSWNEIKPSTMNSAWKNLWKECVTDLTSCPEVSHLVQDIIELGQKLGGEGFSDMKEDDIMEVLWRYGDSHGNESLSVDDSGSTISSDEEEKKELEHALTMKDMTSTKLTEFLSNAHNLAQMAMDMDPNLERSLLFKCGLEHLLMPYKELYAQKQSSGKQYTKVELLQPHNENPTTSNATGPSTSAIDNVPFLSSKNIRNTTSAPSAVG